MAKIKVFISFDFDNDSGLKAMLVGQSKLEDTPFEIIDYSVKQELSGDWKEKVRTRIKKAEQVIILCGEHTDTASGVNAEVKITQEEKKSYFLLAGYAEKTNKKPNAALSTDQMYKWTWENLKILLNGGR
jgi:hypothetical protein